MIYQKVVLFTEVNRYMFLENESIKRHNDHWARLRSANKFWITNYKTLSLDDSFYNWLENTHGIKIHRDFDGNITDKFTIVDNKLYILFLLKFTK